jgi:hypothetical protein
MHSVPAELGEELVGHVHKVEGGTGVKNVALQVKQALASVQVAQETSHAVQVIGILAPFWK